MTTAQESTSSLATEPPVLPAAIRARPGPGPGAIGHYTQSATAAHIAEYAISCARRDGRSAFYAGPNEALALRRYRQWQAALGPDEVGLLTKSVRHRPAAPLVVELRTLRSVLFTAHDQLRDAGYVIFDDIDLLSDPEQETAWEELVIQLPSAVPLPLPIVAGGQRRRNDGLADTGSWHDAPAASRSARRAPGAPLSLG